MARRMLRLSQMREKIAVVALVLGGLARPAGSESAGEPGVKPQTVALLISLHRLHEGEIEIASIAERFAPSEEVRGFAARVRRDHAKLDGRLAELAAKLDVELEPEEPEGTDRPEEDPTERRLASIKTLLERARDAEIDRIFLAGIIRINESEIRRLRAASRGVDHEKVRRYVDQVREVLASHVDRARDLRRAIALR